MTTRFYSNSLRSVIFALAFIALLFGTAVEEFGQEKVTALKSDSQITWTTINYGSAAPVVTIKVDNLTVEPDESTACTIKSLHKAMRMVVVMGTGNWPHNEWNIDSPRIKWLRAVLANCDKEVGK